MPRFMIFSLVPSYVSSYGVVAVVSALCGYACRTFGKTSDDSELCHRGLEHSRSAEPVQCILLPVNNMFSWHVLPVIACFYAVKSAVMFVKHPPMTAFPFLHPSWIE